MVIKHKKILKFVFLFILILILSEITNYLFDFNQLITNSLSEKLTNDQIESFVNRQQKGKWVSYAFIPIYYFIKISLVALLLYAATIFYKRQECSYSQVWNLVVEAEYIFLLAPVFKIFWFSFFQTNYTLEDLQLFYPLSALNIVGYIGLEKWYIYPLQVINVFEIIYWIVLAKGMAKLMGVSNEKGLSAVAVSYGSSLALWVVAVMFFTLNFS